MIDRAGRGAVARSGTAILVAVIALVVSGCAAVTPTAVPRAAESPTPTVSEPIARGRAELAQNRFETALDAFRQAVQGDPRHVDGHVWLGIVSETIGEFEAALEAYRTAAEIAPSVPAWTRLGALARRMGRTEEAIGWLTRAVAGEPSVAVTLFHHLLETGDRDRALALARARGWVLGAIDHCNVTPRRDLSAETLTLVAILLHPATADCALAVARDFTNGGLVRLPRFVLGEVIAHSRDPRARAEAFAFLLRRLPAHDVPSAAESLNVVGYRLEAHHRRPDLALRAWEKALALDPRFSWPLSNTALLHERAGRPEMAIEWARRAVTANPNHQRAQAALGGAAFKLARFEEARAAFERAALLDPNDPQAHSNLGRVLGRLGRRDEAARALLRAIELAPHSNEDRALLAQLGVPGASETATPGGRDPIAAIEEALAVSGVRQSMPSLGRFLRSVLVGLLDVERVGDGAAVTRILEEEITPARLETLIAAHVFAGFDAERVERFIALAGTPVWRRMLALEAAAAAASVDTIEAYVKTAEVTDDGRERLGLARRVDAVTTATETSLGVMFGALIGARRALNEILPPDKRVAPERLIADRSRMEPVTRAAVTASIVFMYREAAPAEIRRYIELLDSEVGRWFGRVHRDGAAGAAEILAEQAMRRIMAARARAPQRPRPAAPQTRAAMPG